MQQSTKEKIVAAAGEEDEKSSKLCKEMIEKYNLHRGESVALLALASSTPYLMIKMKPNAVAIYVGAILYGIGKDDKEKVRELQLAYDEMVRYVFKKLTHTIVENVIAVVEEEDAKDKSGLH